MTKHMAIRILITLLMSLSISTAMVAPEPIFALPCLQEEDEDKKKEETESEKIQAEQKTLADNYKLLEEKLFSLHEFEKDNNPMRSKLLEQAYIQSQEKMTTLQMKQIVKLLTSAKLKDAEGEQAEVLANLNQLLELLQSEDRGKRVRDAIQRNQEYLKEVERILRIQKGIRGQAEGGVDAKRLANSQQKLAERTKKLAEEIKKNEEGSADDPNEDESSTDQEKSTDGADGKGKPNGEQNKDDKGNEKDKPNKDNAGDKKEPSKDSPETPGNGENKEAKPNGKGNQNKPGKPGEPGGEPGEGESGGDSQDSPQDQNPARKRIQSAEQKMRDAQQKLEQARRDDAIDEMVKAEREMAAAKKELEEILKQLRKEEIERTLAMLEGRFRQMLEREVRLHESTRKLDKIVPEQRGTEFEVRAGKLSTQQNEIATEAARALLILIEDGSSVAFPATVEEMHQDMLQVTSRLSAAKVGRITIEIQEDIIDTLDYLIEALVKTQQDMERMKQKGQKGQSGQPGDRPLVDQLAEIKMLRGLQERIFRRHRRYSRFLDDPDDPLGETEDPEMQAALQRLATKQEQLTNIARDIVNEKNK